MAKELPRYKVVKQIEAKLKLDYGKMLATTLKEFFQAVEQLKTTEKEEK